MAEQDNLMLVSEGEDKVPDSSKKKKLNPEQMGDLISTLFGSQEEFERELGDIAGMDEQMNQLGTNMNQVFGNMNRMFSQVFGNGNADMNRMFRVIRTSTRNNEASE